jgi:hypothetical protein
MSGRPWLLIAGKVTVSSERLTHLVGALLADGKAERFALLELLFIGIVEVVGIGRLTGRNLPQAAADQLQPELITDPGAAGPRAVRPVTLVDSGSMMFTM